MNNTLTKIDIVTTPIKAMFGGFLTAVMFLLPLILLPVLVTWLFG